MTTVLAPVLRHPGAGSPPPEPDAGVAVTRGLLGGVAFAAGVVGVAMLLWPGSTGRYFSWRLEPGARRLARRRVATSPRRSCSAGRRRARSWTGAARPVRRPCSGSAAPTLVVTGVHREVFDFGRWQAVAWVVLFAASVTSFATLVARARPRRGRPRPTARDLPDAARAVLAVLAVALRRPSPWCCGPAPGAVSDHGPIAAGPMGLRFLGSWAAFLALVRPLRRRPRLAGGGPPARSPPSSPSRSPALVATVGPPRRPPRRPGAPASLAALAVLADRRGCQCSGRLVEWCSQRRGVEQSGSSSGS